MFALKSQLCKIGYFVLKQSCFFELIDGLIIHLSFCIGIRQIIKMFFQITVKGSTLFRNQSVCTDVFRPEGEGSIKSFTPVRECLPGDSEHQIEVDVSDTGFPCKCNRMNHIFKTMDSSKKGKNMILKCLHSDGKTVDPDICCSH